MELFVELNRQFNKTVLIVTHNMEHVLEYCDDVVVLDKGRVIKHVDKDEFFADERILNELKIAPPAIIHIKQLLKEKGINLKGSYLTIDSLAQAIAKVVNK